MALEVFVEKTKKDAENSLAELQRLRVEHQVLKSEKTVVYRIDADP